MRRWWIVGAALALTLTTAALVTATGQIRLVVNGKEVSPDVPPIIANDRVLVPVRWVSEALGARVDWENATRTVTVTQPDEGSAKMRLDMLEAALAPKSALEAARAWAEAVRTRNGAAQYALLSPNQKGATTPPPGWVTGVSSPWVGGYTIFGSPASTADTARFVVRFSMWMSTGGGVTDTEVLNIKKHPDLRGSPWLIDSIASVTPLAAPLDLEKWLKPGMIPMLAVESVSDEQPTAVFQGWWDVRNGSIDLGQGAFEIRGGLLRAAWDGGNKITILAEQGAPSLVEGSPLMRQSPLRVGVEEMDSTFVNLMRAPSSGTAAQKLTKAKDRDAWVLENRAQSGTGAVTTVTLASPWAGTTFMRPVAIDAAGEAIKVYFETWKTPACGLAEATVTGTAVNYRLVSPDLGIFEAGAGTTMMKWGNSIFIGKQEGSAVSVDLATGKITEEAVITDGLRRFANLYAQRQECPVPPSFAGYGDTLLVSWEVPALAPWVADGQVWDHIVPARCVLAVRDGQVVGRMYAREGKVLVLKGEQVTQTIDTLDQAAFTGWVLPRP